MDLMRPLLCSANALWAYCVLGDTSEQARRGLYPHAIYFLVGMGRGDDKQEQQKVSNTRWL